MAERPPTAVFTCHQPERIEAWQKELDEGMSQFNTRIKTYAERLGKPVLDIRRGWWKIWVRGYVEQDPKATPLNGWRRERGEDTVVPYLRTNAGKVVGAQLEALEFNLPTPPGLPQIVMGDGFMGTFNIEKLGQVWFATITVPLRTDKGLKDTLHEVDPALWTPAKMSAYWAAKEEAA